MTQAEQHNSWLAQPVSWRRWHVIFAAAVIGLLCAAAIILGSHAISNVSKERTRAITSETLSKAQIERLVRRLVRIEQPTAKQIARQIRRSINVCIADSECRPVLVKTLREIANGRTPATSTTTRTPTPTRKPTAKTPTRPSSDRPPKSPSAGPRPPTSQPTAPPPPTPAITVPSITTPVGPTPSVTVTTPCVHITIGGVDIPNPAC